jgi:hypothetical protein
MEEMGKSMTRIAPLEKCSESLSAAMNETVKSRTGIPSLAEVLVKMGVEVVADLQLWR